MQFFIFKKTVMISFRFLENVISIFCKKLSNVTERKGKKKKNQIRIYSKPSVPVYLREEKKKELHTSLWLISILINCETECETCGQVCCWESHKRNTWRPENSVPYRKHHVTLDLVFTTNSETYRWEAWDEAVWSSWAGELECPGFGWRGHRWSFAVWMTDKHKRSDWHIETMFSRTSTKGKKNHFTQVSLFRGTENSYRRLVRRGVLI